MLNLSQIAQQQELEMLREEFPAYWAPEHCILAVSRRGGWAALSKTAWGTPTVQVVVLGKVT